MNGFLSPPLVGILSNGVSPPSLQAEKLEQELQALVSIANYSDGQYFSFLRFLKISFDWRLLRGIILPFGCYISLTLCTLWTLCNK